jgi:F420-dependent methylenetetrahydromethanopterin dehydrogenase
MKTQRREFWHPRQLRVLESDMVEVVSRVVARQQLKHIQERLDEVPLHVGSVPAGSTHMMDHVFYLPSVNFISRST